MQLSRKAFVGAVVATLAVGIAVGAFATSRTASDRRSLMLAQALPPVQAPILPVQMPLTTGIRFSATSPRLINQRPTRLAVRKPSSVSAVKARISPKPGIANGR